MNQQFRTGLYNALCACFGLSPSSSDASILIREAYQEPENAPRPPRSTDVIYYSAEPDPAGQEPPASYVSDKGNASLPGLFGVYDYPGRGGRFHGGLHRGIPPESAGKDF